MEFDTTTAAQLRAVRKRNTQVKRRWMLEDALHAELPDVSYRDVIDVAAQLARLRLHTRQRSVRLQGAPRQNQRQRRRSRCASTQRAAGATSDGHGAADTGPLVARATGPLTDGEKAFLDFLFEEAVKPWC